jgi:hypothetical protein
MRRMENERWDDVVLAALLLLIGIPRVVLAAFYDRPFGVEDTLSIVCVVLGLVLLVARRRPRRSAPPSDLDGI